MRVLVVTSPGAGHLFPMVPLSWALRSAGHDVLVATAGPGVRLAPAAGLPSVDLAPGLDMRDVVATVTQRHGSLWGPDQEGADPEDGRAAFDRAIALFTEVSARCLDGARRWVRDWHPDLVLYGALQAAGAVAAAEHGVPTVEHAISPAAGPDDLATAAWPSLTDHPPTAPLAVVDVVPERFAVAPLNPDVPAVRRLSMRTVPYTGGALVSDDVLLDPGAGAPRVLVTMGTVAPQLGGMGAIRAIVDALADEPGEVLVALGADPDELGAVPSSVRVLPWVPLSVALPACRGIVHHGGAGTTLAAVASGVGQVIVPRGADQYVNADAMVANGCGLRSELEAESVRRAVRRVVSGELDAAVEAMRAETTACPAPTEVAAEIERLTGTDRPPRG